VCQWQVKENKLVVLPCAADVASFGRAYDTAQLRRRLGLTRQPVVMWVGGFFPWHDLELLVASFAQVWQHQPAARLVLVGDGPTRPQTEKLVAEKGLQPAVILTGAIPHSAVPEMVSLADVAVVPVSPVKASAGGTGTPLKLFEYMAAGKAIVATAIDQAAAVIEEGYTGRLVAANDVGGFAEAIGALLSDPAERTRLGQNARRRAVEQYSWEEYTRRLEAIYREVLDGSAGSRRRQRPPPGIRAAA
jgi:glycosyltransferase involved in cell wall biosynthesis